MDTYTVMRWRRVKVMSLNPDIPNCINTLLTIQMERKKLPFYGR